MEIGSGDRRWRKTVEDKAEQGDIFRIEWSEERETTDPVIAARNSYPEHRVAGEPPV